MAELITQLVVQRSVFDPHTHPLFGQSHFSDVATPLQL
jgi:hypothetical protein